MNHPTPYINKKVISSCVTAASLSISNAGIASTSIDHSNYQRIGYAYNTEHQLLYTENHIIKPNETFIVYKSASNQNIIAAQNIKQHHSSPYTPNTTTYDHFKKETVRLINKASSYIYRYFDNISKQGSEETINKQEGLAFNTSIIHYMQDHWQALQSGPQTLTLLNTHTGEHSDEIIVSSDHETCLDKSSFCFEIKNQNWLSAWFESTKIYGFDDKQRLRYYEGPKPSFTPFTNKTVHIHYSYAGEQSAALALSASDANDAFIYQ